MPNHVMNKLQVNGAPDKVKEVMDFIRSDDGKNRIDFNKIVPIPPHIYRGNLGKEQEDLFGEDTWYTWCPKHWGTKWNAICDEDAARCTDNTVFFQTAWGGVPKLIYLLFAKFRDIDIIYEFADEDRGYRCEKYTLTQGHFFDQHYKPESGSDEALALLLCGGRKKMIQMPDIIIGVVVGAAAATAILVPVYRRVIIRLRRDVRRLENRAKENNLTWLAVQISRIGLGE